MELVVVGGTGLISRPIHPAPTMTADLAGALPGSDERQSCHPSGTDSIVSCAQSMTAEAREKIDQTIVWGDTKVLVRLAASVQSLIQSK